MNSSIQQFAACLLVYSKMIDKAVEINGEDTLSIIIYQSVQ